MEHGSIRFLLNDVNLVDIHEHLKECRNSIRN